MDLENNIIKVLKKTRKNRKMTQSDVSEIIGTSSKKVYRVESKLTPLSLAMFIDMCSAYKVAPEHIITQAKNLDVGEK